MIPEAEIKEVKQSSDILGLFRSYGLKLERKGKDWFTSCPFHDDDTPSLSIDPTQNLFHCLGCGEKGNVYQLVQKMDGLTFPEAFEKVSRLHPATAGQAGLQGLNFKPANGTPISYANGTAVHKDVHTRACDGVAERRREQLLATLEASYKHMCDKFVTSPAAHFYMEEKRRLKKDYSMEVGYCPTDFGRKLDKAQQDQLIELGIMRDRKQVHLAACVVFPLRNVEGRLVGLYGRKIRGNGDHYYLPGPREGVFSIYDGGSDSIYITESVIDALSLNQIGVTSVLALHGVNGFTPVHLEWLAAKLPVAEGKKTVYLLLDGDRAGREASARLSLRLKEEGYRVYNLELPDGEDPNSFFCLAANSKAGKRTLKDLHSLPGNPATPVNEELTLKKDGDEYTAAVANRLYQIRGLTGYGFDRMRLTIKASLCGDPSRFHIDNVDLYLARARNAFTEGVAKELGADITTIQDETKSLITALEKERLALKEQGEHSQRPAMTKAEKEEALAALKDKYLFKNLLKDFEACGVIGEEKGKVLGFIGSVSRLLPRPLGILIVSRSGAGKTTLQEAVSSFVPEEALINYTRITGQALFYKDKDGLKHKVLTIEEEEGMEQALYSIRTLQSSQRLSTNTTRTDPKTGRLKSDEYSVEGPVFIMLSTTNPDAMDAETRSRFIIVTVDESDEQTKRIFAAGDALFTSANDFWDEDIETVCRKYHNMHRLLKPLKVRDDIMPLMDYPAELLQHRRERAKYRSLLHAIALTRQYQRPVYAAKRNGKTYEYIQVQVEDVALANELTLEFFHNALDHMAPHTRSLGEIIGGMIEDKGEPYFTRKEVRDYSGWTDWSVRQGLEQLLELEYIAKVAGMNGIQFKYKLLVDVRKESRRNIKLTSVDELKKRMAERKQKKH